VRVSGVEVLRDGATTTYTGDIVVVACGALSSALLMLRSGNDDHPNGSSLVGRNYMRHNDTTILAISRTPNPTKFQRTLGLNDFYFGADDWNFPLGHIQMVGKSDGAQIHGEGLLELLQWFPNKPSDWLAEHSIDFWLTSEDVPLPQNRIFYDGDRVNLDLTPTNLEAHRRLPDIPGFSRTSRKANGVIVMSYARTGVYYIAIKRDAFDTRRSQI
jgi:choline dehydrogenase-like flavoprotein